jgi:hypothetical protein
MTPALRSLLVLLVLAAVSAAMGLRIQDELLRSPEIPGTVEPDQTSGGNDADQTIEIPDMPRYDPPPIERFAAALDRPLFSPDRQPSADAPVAPGPELQALTATLQGILFASSGSVALLTAVGETTPVRVSQGEIFLGWRLLEIHPDSVVFEKDDETVTLELIYRGQSEPAEPAGRRVRQQP